MTRIFCPKCGKTTDKLYNSLCSECFAKGLKISEKLPETISARECKECGNFYVGKQPLDSVEGVIEANLGNLKSREIESLNYRTHDDKVIVTIHFEADGLKGSEEKTVQLVRSKMICKFCTMKLSGYYTSQIQLRGKLDSEKIFKEIEKIVENAKRDDPYSFISKVVELKEGLDLLIGSKPIANQIAKYLKKRYRTMNKLTTSLVGSKKGKSVYRDTILISFEEENGKGN